MKTGDQTLRNRTNAASSTGPKTEEGKAKSAQNARRHGATAAPKPSSVVAWLAIILGKPGISPDDTRPNDDLGYRALELAIAEVRLASAEQALTEAEASAGKELETLAILDAMIGSIVDGVKDPKTHPIDRWSSLSAIALLSLRRRETARDNARQNTLLKRYAREARSARSRAIRAWAATASSR